MVKKSDHADRKNLPALVNGEPRLTYPIEAAQQRSIGQDGWRVLVNSIFPSARSPQAVLMAWDYCRVRKLDIFKRPVHIVPMYSSEAQDWVETVWPGINEVCTTATRTNAWAGMDEPVFGPSITKEFVGDVRFYENGQEKWEEKKVTVTFPEWVQITVYRMVHNHRSPFCVRVYWLETYAPLRRRCELPNDMWAKRPAGQLQKCGIAASLRAGFPEEADYTAEEMEGKDLDLVPENVTVRTPGCDLNGGHKSKVIDDVLSAEPADADVIAPEEISEEVRALVKDWIDRLRVSRAFRTAADYAASRLQGQDYEYAVQEIRKLRKELHPEKIPVAA